MSIIGILGSIVGVIGKIAGVAVSVMRIAKPILEALRPAIPELETAMEYLEEGAIKVGEEGDDFLDRNLQTILDLEDVSSRGAVVFGLLNELSADLRIASQESTPDIITEAEAAGFIEKFGMIKEALADWGPAMDKALVSIDKTEKSL